jgi:MFS family permease
MFYQLKSFDETLPDSTVATQAGLLASSFTGAQFLTAMMWGRISDSDRGGRKLVLLIGLSGTGESWIHDVTQSLELILCFQLSHVWGLGSRKLSTKQYSFVHLVDLAMEISVS